MRFDAQPRLSGARVVLRPLERGDYAPLQQAAADPLIWAQHPEPDRWREPVFSRLFDRLLESGGALLAQDRASGNVIGSSSYYAWNPEANDVVVGYTFLARSCWGGQYNSDLKRLMLQHAFRFVDRVWFHVGTANLRSQAAMRKIGARLSHEAVRESGGVTTSFLHYYIDKSDFSEPV